MTVAPALPTPMTKSRAPEVKVKPRDGAEGSEVSFGAWLRRQREARGVSLREIADSTRISLRYLEALELDRFDALPAQVFARGFLREYARVVGLDADEVVNLYLVAARAGHAPEESLSSPPARPVRVGNPWGYGLLLGAAMVVLLAIAVALSFWAERRSRASVPSVASVVPPPVAVVGAPGAVDRTDRTDRVTRIDRDEGAPIAPSSTPSAEAPVAPSPGTPGPAGAQPGIAVSSPPATSSRAPLAVMLSFAADCWVEAVVDGRRRPGELRIGGETLTLEGVDSVSLTLGNRAGVTVTANGQPVALPDSGSNVVRSLRLDRAAYPAPAGEPPR